MTPPSQWSPRSGAPESGAGSAFGFVQLELPWVLGPADGRYVVRSRGANTTPEHVLVLATLGAPERRLLRGRRARGAPAEPDPTPVATARATVIAAEPFAHDGAAQRWLAAIDARPEVLRALAVLNRALAAHRVASADPHVREAELEQALALRLGYGAGDEVARGLWTQARELPLTGSGHGRSRRPAALRPQERFAALLGGRDRALACEELTLRARSDLDALRTREGALSLGLALRTALAELPRSSPAPDLANRVQELSAHEPEVARLARTALRDPVSPEDSVKVLVPALERLEAALRARSAAGVG